jgi:hypothetical protein
VAGPAIAFGSRALTEDIRSDPRSVGPLMTYEPTTSARTLNGSWAKHGLYLDLD